MYIRNLLSRSLTGFVTERYITLPSTLSDVWWWSRREIVPRAETLPGNPGQM